MHGLAFVPRSGAGAAHVEPVAQRGPVGELVEAASARVITSAMGERQMFPVQTKTMR
jgi:hypothetical protein